MPDHKRKSSGPAPLQMNAEVQGLMTTYIEKIRPQIGGSLDPSEKMFLKKDCQPFTKGTVGRRMSQEPLTVEEQDAVKEAFRRQIQSGSVLPMKEVAATMKKHPVLQKIAKVPGKVKRVTDKIRSLICSEPRISPQDLPEPAKDAQTAFWVMAPTVSGPGSVCGAKLFTDKENEAIEARFCDHSKPPGVQQLRKIFQEDPTLRPIFEKYTFQQCKDKVKNYIKKMNRKAQQ